MLVVPANPYEVASLIHGYGIKTRRPDSSSVIDVRLREEAALVVKRANQQIKNVFPL